MSADAAEEAFAALTAGLLEQPGVAQGRAFHAPGLKVEGKIFAMLVGGELVLKLPAARCAELVAAGGARAFRSGGRAMREWVVLEGVEADAWAAQAAEALDYVRPVSDTS